MLLAAQRMEILGGRGEVPDDEVFLGTELEEALEPRAGVLGAHAFVAVRQQHHEVAWRLPFRLGGGNELVDDDLRAIREISELGLPQRQHAGVGKRVAVVEAEHRELRQERVVHAEFRLLRIDMFERDVALAGFEIVEHRVALGERPAAAILAGQTHGRAFLQQRAEGERLGEGPVKRPAARQRLDAARQEALLQRGIQMKLAGHSGEHAADFLQRLRRDARRHRRVRIIRLVDARGAAEGGAVAGFLEHQHFLVAALELVPDGLLQRVDIGLGNDVLGDELALVNFPEGRAVRDLFGDRRLGESRLVRLVVALAAVAIHVDDDVPAEALAELERENGSPVELHRLLAIHMQDRRFDHLRHVGRIGRRARVGRHRREADLVVDDKMDRAAGAVALELGKIEHFGDRALAGEGSVAMKQDGQHLLAVDFPTAEIIEDPLAGPGLAFDD